MGIALFEEYPRLAETFGYVELCDLPTPVARLEKAGEALGVSSLYIKRDDISAAEFGGNKVRTLEFLLGDAIQSKAKRVIAVGLPGTSMALAAAIYGSRYDFDLQILLIAQYPTKEAQHNLLIFKKLGANIRHVPTIPKMLININKLMMGGLAKHRKMPKMLSPSSPRGMAGYVNAGFELKGQIERGEIPEPDRLYIAMGLLGTATGITLGLRAAGLKTKVIAVHVQPHDAKGVAQTKVKMVKLLGKANKFLHDHDSSFPSVAIQAEEIEIRCDAPGQESDTLFDAGLGLIDSVQELEGITLDASWTAQAWAAMQRDIAREGLCDEVILFWHTYNSRPTPVDLDDVDYHTLPEAFHYYFEGEMRINNKPIFAEH
jgi:D-cysteine desulfhydrase